MNSFFLPGASSIEQPQKLGTVVEYQEGLAKSSPSLPEVKQQLEALGVQLAGYAPQSMTLEKAKILRGHWDWVNKTKLELEERAAKEPFSILESGVSARHVVRSCSFIASHLLSVTTSKNEHTHTQKENKQKTEIVLQNVDASTLAHTAGKLQEALTLLLSSLGRSAYGGAGLGIHMQLDRRQHFS